MINLERQEGDAQSDDEGGVSLPAKNACAGSTVNFMPHTVQHAC